MDEDALVRRLDEIERMVAKGGPVGGEACRAELAHWRRLEADSEFRMSLPTPTSQLVFLTVCRCYGLQPYRAAKQRKTTISVRMPSGFMYVVFKPRVAAILHAVEEAAVEAIKRVMEKWSAQVGGVPESICPECGHAESTSGGDLDDGEESAASTSGTVSQGRLMIES
jgi:hypothetical protein